MFYLKRLSLIAMAAAVLAIVIASLVTGAQPAGRGQNKLVCSADAPATCTLEKNGRTATIDTTAGGAASVYLPGYNDSFYGVQVGQVTALSNTYIGTAGIDPRWSIPIDSDHDGDTDYFLLVPFNTCDNGAGLVDVIHDTTCTIYGNGGVTYPNWTAYGTANTNDYIALTDNYAFIIADSSSGPANRWTVSNVTVGKPGK
jgi:hypothetical protein